LAEQSFFEPNRDGLAGRLGARGSRDADSDREWRAANRRVTGADAPHTDTAAIGRPEFGRLDPLGVVLGLTAAPILKTRGGATNKL